MADRYQLHVSTVPNLLSCGEKFRRRYIEGTSVPPALYLVAGTAVDVTITANLQQYMLEGSSMPEARIEEYARMAAEAELARAYTLDVMQSIPPEGWEWVIARTIRLASLHATDVLPKMLKQAAPTHVQYKFSIELDALLKDRGIDFALDLVGTMDIRQGRIIRDTKTASGKPAQDEAERGKYADQLTGYALGLLVMEGQLPERMYLDYLVDYKRGPKAITLETTRTMQHIGAYLDKLAECARRLMTSDFPAHVSWKCNMCEYKGDCPYRNGETNDEGERILSINDHGDGPSNESTF